MKKLTSVPNLNILSQKLANPLLNGALHFLIGIPFLLPKDWPIKKETTFAFGRFTTRFGKFFANYIDIFHKTEVLMVILRG